MREIAPAHEEHWFQRMVHDDPPSIKSVTGRPQRNRPAHPPLRSALGERWTTILWREYKVGEEPPRDLKRESRAIAVWPLNAGLNGLGPLRRVRCRAGRSRISQALFVVLGEKGVAIGAHGG